MTTRAIAIPLTRPLTVGWRNATRRALADPPKIKMRSETRISDAEIEREYDVSSLSHPGTWHRLVVNVTDDIPACACACDWFRHRGDPCRHAAAVMLSEGRLMEEDGIARTHGLTDLWAYEDA